MFAVVGDADQLVTIDLIHMSYEIRRTLFLRTCYRHNYTFNSQQTEGANAMNMVIFSQYMTATVFKLPLINAVTTVAVSQHAPHAV